MQETIDGLDSLELCAYLCVQFGVDTESWMASDASCLGAGCDQQATEKLKTNNNNLLGLLCWAATQRVNRASALGREGLGVEAKWTSWWDEDAGGHQTLQQLGRRRQGDRLARGRGGRRKQENNNKKKKEKKQKKLNKKEKRDPIKLAALRLVGARLVHGSGATPIFPVLDPSRWAPQSAHIPPGDGRDPYWLPAL